MAHYDSISPNNQGSNLLWLSAKINNKPLDMMLDSGATICCLARCCLTSSPCLKSLPLQRYDGPGLLNANETLLTPCGVITANLTIGHPAVCYVDFIIIDSLPYSCIICFSFLSKVKKWGVDNTLQTFFLDNSSIKVSNDPPFQDFLHLFTPRKYTIPPKKTLKVAAIANSIALNPFRPFSELPYLIDVYDTFKQRLGVKIIPIIRTIAHQNASVSTIIVSNSNTPKTFGKGTKIDCATSAFEEHTAVYEDAVNLISSETCTHPPNTRDPLAVLCDQVAHLPPEQFRQAKQLLLEYSDILSLSNADRQSQYC